MIFESMEQKELEEIEMTMEKCHEKEKEIKTKYKNISNGQLFYDNNFKVYSYYNGDLHAEKMTGTANVVAWRTQGTVGNLAQGSFQFNGNGELAPASLPST